jgi:predicted  nucleic acid-binding Zn-ribbon protein
VNIIADLQELQNVKQQLADYIQQAASSNLKQEIDRLNQQVEEAIKKVQAGIPKGIDPTELAAKITSITRAQYNIGDQVSKLGPQAGSKDPEISSHIQSIKNALDEINQYYQHSSSNNFGN